jgi:hypothetical protein
MFYIKIKRFVMVFRALALVAAVGMSSKIQAASANIVWVSFHSADNTPSAAAVGAGFTQAPDVEYTQLLQSAGHTVTRYVTTAAPDVNFLNTFDLVIISRSVPSGHYQTPESNALWHSVTAPTMVLGGYVLRASRLGYTYGETMVDASDTFALTVLEPTHPLFTGVDLDAANTMVNPYAHRVTYNSVLQSGISVNNDLVTDGSTMLATVGTDTDAAFGGMIIAEYPAGTMMGNASGDITAAKRLVFLTGSRESGITAEAAGLFDLESDGARLFLNAVSYMAGVDVVEPPPLVSAVRPAVGATQHYAPLGVSLRATSGHPGGIPATNIFLVLNGTDVTSSLTITGTPQERAISFMGLVPNTNYTGALTVRDAGGSESVLNLIFDTLPPLTLPPAFAYPTNEAVAAAPGMRARIVQAFDYSVLANTAVRAEAQLAGTLIDPDTTEPFLNLATPSTDNPDGSYNQQRINWSVIAGTSAEVGNFRDPEFPDELIPGLAHNLNFTAEVLTYLELSPGRHFMSVNSDDGFVVYTGAHHRDALPVALGRFDGGRAPADTVFQFDVSEPGLYPFRLVYYQGTGDGSLEWFSVEPESGEKILLNDRTHPQGLRAWRQVSAERSYIVSLEPTPGQGNVEVDADVTITLQDAGTLVQEGTVRMTINGQTVPAQATKAGGLTTVRYNPAQDFPGDTKHSVSLAYTDSASDERTINYEFTTRFVPPVLQEGANIVWVSFHPADDEPSAAAATALFTNASDVEYTRLLDATGHTVTRYVTTPTPDVDYLNTFDLVIVSRAVPSGNYQNADSTALWHAITAPTIHLGGYVLRANRLGFTTGDGIPDVSSASIRLKVNAPTHPIFSGIPLDAATNMVNAYAHAVSFNGTAQRGISVNNSPIVSGGTLLATVGTAGDAAFGGMIIGEYPSGTVMGNASADVTAGKRLVFLTGSRENNGLTSEGAGIFDLDGDGSRMFLNAVRYMAGLAEPVTVSLAASLSSSGELVISWPETGSESYALQATPALVPANWQPLTGSPVVADGRRTVTVPATESARFYRLIQP